MLTALPYKILSAGRMLLLIFLFCVFPALSLKIHHLVVVLDFKVLELPGWKIDRKHVVQLLESAALGLRKAKEAKQRTEAANAGEDKSNLAAEVSLILVDEEGNANGQGDGADLVKG